MNSLCVIGLSFAICMALVGLGHCGPRIVDGQKAKLGQFPYQASVMRYNVHWCGGSLISHNYVLTASHCVFKDGDNGTKIQVLPEDVQVRVGNIKNNVGGELRQVKEINVNPNYNFPNYDVTLLLLAEPIEYTDDIKPIPLAKKMPPVGSTIIASGFGQVSTKGDQSKQLLYTKLTTESKKECAKELRANYTTIFCGKHPAYSGICQGDSGGPGAYDNTLLGVVSFTPGSCETTLPDGFAKVPVLRSWIVENSDLNDDGDDDEEEAYDYDFGYDYDDEDDEDDEDDDDDDDDEDDGYDD